MREAVEGRPFSCPKRLGAKADAAAGARSDSNCPSAVLLARLRTASRAIDCLPDFDCAPRRQFSEAGAKGDAASRQTANPSRGPRRDRPARVRPSVRRRAREARKGPAAAAASAPSTLRVLSRLIAARNLRPGLPRLAGLSRATGFRPLILRLLIQSRTEPRVPSGWRGARPDRL
jgi:hypothetical protein